MVFESLKQSSSFQSPSTKKSTEFRLAIPYKIGFIGVGNLAQAMIKG
ncbi:MAG: hypothetical protein COT73_04560, partial [Bdellovibrio sp. CG10_big_fil_rev_8_21_14_0_10_47_8]